MEFKTKYNKGDTIYFMSGQMPTKDKICGIEVFYGHQTDLDGSTRASHENEYHTKYYVSSLVRPINEIDAFETKEELREALFKAL